MNVAKKSKLLRKRSYVSDSLHMCFLVFAEIQHMPSMNQHGSAEAGWTTASTYLTAVAFVDVEEEKDEAG